MDAQTAHPAPEPIGACRLDELEEGRPRCIRLPNGRQVALVRAGASVRAFSMRCPHRGGPLYKGRICYGLRSDSPGDMTLDESRMVINCPWHNWEFSLCSGESKFDPAKRIAVYPTDVVDGVVRVHYGAGRPTPRTPVVQS
jgi:nitrite reductase/ring-hydroxylating ferredoxin subunit